MSEVRVILNLSLEEVGIILVALELNARLQDMEARRWLISNPAMSDDHSLAAMIIDQLRDKIVGRVG